MKLKPIETKTINDYVNRKFIESRKGTVGFVCPKCFSVTYMDVDNEQKFPFGHKYAIPKFNLYDIECDYCHEQLENIFDVDPNIAQIIADLNRLGYKTTASCEGHTYYYEDEGYYQDGDDEIFDRPHEGYETTSAYIGFESDKIKKDYPEPPKGWYWDEYGADDDPVKVTCLRYDPHRDFHTDWVNDESWKEEALRALYLWTHMIWLHLVDYTMANNNQE